MTRIALIVFLTSFLHIIGNGQAINASDVLEKSIKYHDPKGEWGSFNFQMEFLSERPNGPDRNSMVIINNNTGYFKLEESKNNMVITLDNCQQIPEGKTCDQVKRTRNYYLYLWGLPMKLKDEGTPLEGTVGEERFDQYDCYVLRVPYEQDVWYFYIDKSDYRLRGYMFYKDEPAKKGEVIYLKEEEKVGSMILPKVRSWYTTPDNKFLGTDILKSAK